MCFTNDKKSLAAPPASVVQQVPVGSFRIFGGLFIVQEPESCIKPALQLLLDQALGSL